MDDLKARGLSHGNNWVWGSDVANKNGWVSCDFYDEAMGPPPPSSSGERKKEETEVLRHEFNPNLISMQVQCERGDLVIGFLR